MTSPLRTGLSRRTLLSLSGLGAGAFALAACGGPTVGGDSSKDKAKEVDFEGVKPAKKIDFWSTHPGGAKEIETKLIKDFTDKTGIEVNLVTGGQNYEEIAQRFQTAQAANSGLPAVVVLSDVWWFRYFMNGNIIPLDNLLKKLDFQLDDYRETLVEDYQYDGKQWAMPYGRSTPLFYYNRDHFKAAGLEDRAPKTWDEFAEWSKKLTEADTPFMYPDLAGYAGWTLQNVLWGRGAEYSHEWDLKLTEQKSVEAFQWVQDSVHKEKWGQVASSDSADSFAGGVCSATIASTGSLVGILEAAKFDVGVGFLPAGPVDGPVCPTGGAGLGIPAAIKPEEQLAAAEFIKFMGEPENTAQFSAATGYMPNRKSSDMSAIIKETPQIETAIKQLEHTRKQDYARVYLPGADQEIAKAVASILNDKADVKQSLEGLQKNLQGIYDKDVKPKVEKKK
ncbi:ABC transporter substrate-binding protein [Helcobacillus massiliensis]|uniref:ABC transporter substrate-binding protein n=1 Tax=Helcobacillus massiliensis TaxID=521392 RepID=UPI0037C01FAE